MDLGEALLVLPVVGAAMCLYLTPAFIAERRVHPHAAALISLNLLLGWTVIGWAAALVWALSARKPPSKSGRRRRHARAPR